MRDELLELERKFWEASSAGDGEFYRSHVTDDALYVFPGPTGVLDKDECALVVERNRTPWSWFRIEEPRFIDLAPDAVLLTYTFSVAARGRPAVLDACQHDLSRDRRRLEARVPPANDGAEQLTAARARRAR